MNRSPESYPERQKTLDSQLMQKLSKHRGLVLGLTLALGLGAAGAEKIRHEQDEDERAESLAAILDKAPEIHVTVPEKGELPDSEASLTPEQILESKLRIEVGDKVIDHLLKIPDGDPRTNVPLYASPEVNGFEKIDPSEDRALTQAVRTFPRGFGQNINHLIYADKDLPMDTSYGMKKGELEAAHVHVDSIVFFKSSREASKNTLINNYLTHEMTHTMDWERNPFLKSKERLALLQKVIERVYSQDRYRSDYVEDISSKNPQSSLYHKAVEYFAEIGGAYLSKQFELLPKEDKKIIADVVSNVDPRFSRQESLRQRESIVASLQK